MGDFDKQQTPSASAEKKKLVVVCSLGAILLGIGAVHFLKPNPSSAMAAAVVPTDASGAPFVPNADETPAQARAALQDDPTAKLLRGPQGADPLLDEVPRNPFRISQTWEASLVRPAEVPVAEGPRVQAYVPATAAPKTVDASTLKLSGIFRQDQKLYAIINGDIYTVGMAIDNARILDITSNKVTLQRVESINGPKVTLSLESKLK